MLYELQTECLHFIHQYLLHCFRCKQWVVRLRNATLDTIPHEQLNKNYRVCSKHFLSTQFKIPSNVYVC